MKAIDAKELTNMIRVGEKRLKEHAEFINSLNVFPVPDGDTGTNMSLSFTSGLSYVEEQAQEETGQVAEHLAKGLLMGARGNSGVILSQLFRGFAKGLEGSQEASALDLANAFQHGVETAYKAVMKPVEGTILTVAREAAQAGLEKAKTTDDVLAVMTAVHQMADEALKKTPEQLPVLKEVGVVDSGGQGLFTIYTGFLEALKGEHVPIEQTLSVESTDVTQLAHHENHASHTNVRPEDIKYGYCTEIMVRLGEGRTVEEEFSYEDFREYLNQLGDSLLVVNDDEIVKVHVHTEQPGEVMNYGQRFGSLIKIKVDNMREQNQALHRGEASEAKERVAHGILTVVAGQGLAEMFTNLGASKIINGGQTMNPSTEDIAQAIEQVNAEDVIILPNNKNIFMAAKQAADLADKPVVVIPTKTVSQGLSAMLGFNQLDSLEANEEQMTAELANVTSGQITQATRKTSIDGLAIEKDDYMGLVEGDIVTSCADLEESCLMTVEKMLAEDSEIITLIYGADISRKAAEELAAKLEEKYTDLDLEVYDGGQPVYSYFISVE